MEELSSKFIGAFLFCFFFILCFLHFYSSLFIALFRVDGEAYAANAPLSNEVQCHFQSDLCFLEPKSLNFHENNMSDHNFQSNVFFLEDSILLIKRAEMVSFLA